MRERRAPARPLRSSSDYTITAGSAFTMTAEVRAKSANGYEAVVPAGYVGLWCSDASDNEFDDFKVRDCAGPFEVDGRWFGDRGAARVDESDNNVLELYGSDAADHSVVRRGFRGDG